MYHRIYARVYVPLYKNLLSSFYISFFRIKSQSHTLCFSLLTMYGILVLVLRGISGLIWHQLHTKKEGFLNPSDLGLRGRRGKEEDAGSPQGEKQRGQRWSGAGRARGILGGCW